MVGMRDDDSLFIVDPRALVAGGAKAAQLCIGTVASPGKVLVRQKLDRGETHPLPPPMVLHRLIGSHGQVAQSGFVAFLT